MLFAECCRHKTKRKETQTELRLKQISNIKTKNTTLFLIKLLWAMYAPYLSKEALTTAITEIAIAKLLFKYADEEILRDVALLVFASDTNKGRIDFMTYLPQGEVTKLILNRYSSGDIGSMLPLLPYSENFEVVDMIFKSIVSTHGNNGYKRYRLCRKARY